MNTDKSDLKIEIDSDLIIETRKRLYLLYQHSSA